MLVSRKDEELRGERGGRMVRKRPAIYSAGNRQARMRYRARVQA
jgi:hypothetical protein